MVNKGKRLSHWLLLAGVVGVLHGCGGKQAVVAPVVSAPEPVRVQVSQPVTEELAEDVLFRALGLVGTPYRYGGNTPESGFDCSGLIGFVYADSTGIKLPRTTAAMSQTRAPAVSKQQLRSGDVVFFATSGGRKVSHAGIYVGEGRFVHAPSSGGTVRLDSLSSPYWQKAYLNAKRFIAEVD